MLSKVKKFNRIVRYRKKLKSCLNLFIYEEKLDGIFKQFNIYKLPDVTISDLLKQYAYQEENNIILKTDFSDGISPVNDYFFLCLIAKAGRNKKIF